LLIRIDEIKDDGLTLVREERPESFPALAEVVASGESAFVAPLTVELKAFWVGEMIEVEGTIQTRVRLECGRCLVEYDEPLVTRFALTFVRELPEVAGEPDDEEIELSAEEMGLIPLAGDEIDLGEALAEQVIMALPMRPLCQPECRGLCPQCGANLNEADCGCAPRVFNPKFAALKDLKLDK